MKKIKKIWLASSISLLSLVAITPMIVSCSESNNYSEWYRELINDSRAPTADDPSSNLIQKGIYENREISKEQCNFSIYIFPNHKEKIFMIEAYRDKNWNYYASEYDNIEGKDEDIVSSKSNTLIIPNKIMYNNEWYTFAGWGDELSTGLLTWRNRPDILKSIRFDSNITRSVNCTIQNIDCGNHSSMLSNLVDIKNYPLLTRDKVCTSNWEFPYNRLLGLKTCSNFKELTFNTKVKSLDSDPENLIAMPILETAEHFINYEIPNEVNVILTGTFNKVTYNGFQIGDNIKIIEPNAFGPSCPATIIPERFYEDNIPERLFYDMTIDNSFKIPSTCQKIGKKAFAESSFENQNFYIPEGVTTIEESAFSFISNKSQLNEEITFYLPDSLKEFKLGINSNVINEDFFPFYCGNIGWRDDFNVSFVVKSERVKNLLIDTAHNCKIYDFEKKVNITIDPNWDQNM